MNTQREVIDYLKKRSQQEIDLVNELEAKVKDRTPTLEEMSQAYISLGKIQMIEEIVNQMFDDTKKRLYN